MLDRSWVGRALDQSFSDDIQQTKSCPMGENGEFHTFVTDGPTFKNRVEIRRSAVVLNSGLWSMDIQECALAHREYQAG